MAIDRWHTAHMRLRPYMSGVVLLAMALWAARSATAEEVRYGFSSPMSPYAATNQDLPSAAMSSTTTADFHRRPGETEPLETVSYEQPCDACGPTDPCGCGTAWYDNLLLFGGLDGSKQPQDFGVNAQFGGRFHVNMGLPLWEAQGLGVQIGTALNYTDNAVQVFERVDGTKDRFQNYTTIGLFQRTEAGLIWAVGYDFLYEDYYDDFNLGQWRGDVGFAVDEQNEFGTWFAISNKRDSGHYLTMLKPRSGWVSPKGTAKSIWHWVTCVRSENGWCSGRMSSCR